MQRPEFHEAANIFPLDEEHIDSLADDIRSFGLMEPIELLNGKILDGRRRQIACEKAGITPRYKHVEAADPVAYVLSLNLHRRHLTPSQMSMVGARAREWYDRQAKERQKASGGDRKSNKSVMANLPQPIDAGTARDHAAKAVGVSGKSIDYATKVLKTGVPELVQAVDEGRMAVSTAAIVASEPEDTQRREATTTSNGKPRTRRYGTGPHGERLPANGVAVVDEPITEPDPDSNPGDRKVLGKGITLAHEAINCLKRIPKNDALRKRGFQLVTDWIRHNP